MMNWWGILVKEKFKIDVTNINGKTRNNILKLNVIISFFNKFFSIFLSYMLIPLTINYLNQEIYGIWVTLLSILSWFSFCDIGLGNGLRNKLTQCLSNGDIKDAKKYVSTAYITISCIVVVLVLPLVVVIPLVNWNVILNTNAIANFELIKLVYITLSFFLMNFILSIINQIYYAYQKSMVVGFIQVISNALTLIGVILLRFLPNKSVLYLALIYGMSTLVTNLIFSILFFLKNKELRPKIHEFSKDKVSDILTLGLKFFIIQIATVVIFTTDNIVITQVVGPKYVTGYNIVQKIFGIITIMHTILVTPLWSAYTEAYIKKDYTWIKKVILKLNIFMIPIIITIGLLFVSFNFIVTIWIGQPMNVSKNLIFLVGVYTIISVWNNIYAYFLNGVGYLQISFVLCTIIASLNIPLSIYMGKYLNLGLEGVVFANILCLSIGAIIQPIQTYIVLNNKFKGSIFYK